MIPTENLQVAVPQLKERARSSPRETPPNMPRLSFLGALIGQRGSGKTHALCQLVQMYDKSRSFDKVYLFSPSLWNDEKYQQFLIGANKSYKLRTFTDFDNAIWEEVTAEIDADLQAYEDYLADKKLWVKFCRMQNTDKLGYDELMRLEKMGWQEPESQFTMGPPTSLVIFDDLVGNRDLYRADTKGPFARFAILHRHKKTSILFLAQIFHNGIPRQLRANLTFVLLWAQKSDKLKADIAEELSAHVSEKLFIKMWEQAVDRPYGFLFVNYDGPKELRFRSGFTENFVLSE